MLQDTTAILPVEQAWPGCYLALGEVESFARPQAPYFVDNLANFVLILLIIVFFLFAYERILEGLHYILSSFLSLKKMLIIENQYNTQVSRNTLLIFSAIVLSFILANHNEEAEIVDNTYPVVFRFLLIFVGLAGYLLFKRVFFQILSWVNCSNVFMTVNKISYSYMILWILIVLVGAILNAVFFNLDFSLVALYVCLSAILVFPLYFIRGYQLIISNGFSQFFYILYLCTLEILPVMILVHLIFR